MSNGNPTPDPTNTTQGNWPLLLQKLGPILMQMSKQQQPQGGGAPPVPGMAPPMPPPPTLGQPQGGLDIKADPRASIGSLPMPNPQPQRQAQGYQPYQGRYPLTPKNQGAYDMVQGVTGFVTSWAQKQDQAKHAEAANAAQSLMQAIDAKDFVSANDILHQNEKLFNKVYKGWLQKAEKAQEPQKKEKPPDPDVQGFEKGINDYFSGKSQTAPQAPRTLGASKQAPGGYYLPRATPGQQAQGQQASSMNQALQQQPERAVPGEVVSAEDKVKLQESFNKMYTDYQKSNLEYQTKQTEFQKAQFEAQTALSKGATEQETAKQNAARAASEASAAASRLDISKTQLLIEQAKLRGQIQKGANAKVPASVQGQFAALTQAQTVLKGVDAKKGFAPEQFMSLQNLLTKAGLPTFAKSLTTSWMKSHLMPGNNYADPATIGEAINQQKQALIGGFPSLAPKQEADTGDDESDDSDVITITPEDMNK